MKAIVFDAYGTLFDVTSVAEVCDKQFPGYGQQISEMWRQKQLEYTWLRALMRRYEDFAAVNRGALQYALHQLNLWYDNEMLNTVLASYLTLPTFPDVPQALHALRTHRLAILSNGTQGMLEALVRNAGLLWNFDHVLSVDPLKTYKPDPRVYQLAVNALGVAKERILFISSNGWDVAGAKSFGFTVGWLNRRGKVAEELGIRPDYEVANLLELIERAFR